MKTGLRRRSRYRRIDIAWLQLLSTSCGIGLPPLPGTKWLLRRREMGEAPHLSFPPLCRLVQNPDPVTAATARDGPALQSQLA